MADVLILADTSARRRCGTRCRSPIPDRVPLRRARRPSRRRRQLARVAARSPRRTRLEVMPYEALGLDELVRERHDARRGLPRRCTPAPARSSGSPARPCRPTFPLELADRLRENGIEVSVDRGHFEERRRRKNATRSQGCAARSARARRRSTSRATCFARDASNGTLMLDGEPLTSERHQGGGRARLRRARRVRRGVHRLARRADGDRARERPRRDPARRADRLRSLPARPRDRRLHGHDAHVRRRDARRSCASTTGSQGGARARRRGSEAGRERPRAIEFAATSSTSTGIRRS